MSKPVVVIYAAKSTPDAKDSLGTQLEACRKATEGRTVLGEFSEENASGYKANRGPQLEAAIQAAKDNAPCELWVWHTTRLGRGTGFAGEARALGALLYDLRASGVTVRSVDDDAFATNEVLWGITSNLASQYSANLSNWVKAGKERQRAAGFVLGGPCPDGYHQPTKGGPRVIDPSRSPVIARMFELAAEHGDPQVARKLNQDGYRRKNGAPWDRRSVQAIVTNEHYGGVWKNKDGSPIPSIVTPEDWQAVQDARAARDRSAGGRKKADKGGRPTTQFVLAKLGTCGRCGGRMYAAKGVYKRKDGSHQRDYLCRSVHARDGTCDMPKITAGPVDLAVVARLRDYFADFDGFVQRYASDHASQRDSLERRLALADEEQTAAEKVAKRAQERYDRALAEDADDATADALLGTLARATAKAKTATEDVDRLRAELAEHGDADTAAHEALTWWRSLALAVRDGLDSESIGEVNGHLLEVLEEVVMHARPNGSTHLQVIFKRGSFEPGTKLVGFDNDGDAIEEPDFDSEGFWVPDSVDVYVDAPSAARRQGRAITD